MYVSKLIYIYILIISCTSIGCTDKKKMSSPLEASGFSIFYNNDSESEKWAKYLYEHLSKRTEHQGALLFQTEQENFMKFIIILDRDLKSDYDIDCNTKVLTLKARNDQVMIWLLYQLMEELSTNDDRFIANDLPPAILDFHNKKDSFDFQYREPHFSPILYDVESVPILGAHSVDKDWGIWGHNLGKVLVSDEEHTIYAKRAGRYTEKQFCFSNDEIYKQLVQYIDNNFGDGNASCQRFMIMPNDNDIVCDCNLCEANGNTDINSTPAVAALIRKLAAHYPHHYFFTSAYLSTMSVPKDKWPKNAGVIISTIELPKGIELNKNDKKVKDFINRVEQWKVQTDNIYIWDYAANFDDYLTPLPILYGLKRQLQFYKSIGINGIFLNGSGYDYSPFEDMKTYVAANLMIDCKLSVDTLCRNYFYKFYPVAGRTLTNYYLTLEKKFRRQQKSYNIYGGFEETVKSYFNIEDFMDLYSLLPSLIVQAEGQEQEKLRKLYTALTYTRLQVAYIQRDKLYGYAMIDNPDIHIRPEVRRLIDQLGQHNKFEHLNNYKESDGSLEVYLQNWEQVYSDELSRNMLLNKPIEILSQMDEGYENITFLVDGIPGFSGSYHQGWYLNSVDDLNIRFYTETVHDAERLLLRFLSDEKHHIYPAEKVELYKDDIFYKEFGIEYVPQEEGSQVISISEPIDFSGAKSVLIKMYRKKTGKSTLACDEIWLN